MAEQLGSATGRQPIVNRVAFEVSDGNDGTCRGSAHVGVPRQKHRSAVESPGEYDSLAR